MEGGTNDDMIQKRFGLDIPVFVILQEKLEDILSKAPDWWGTSDKDIYDNLIFVMSPATAEIIAEKIGEPTKELEQMIAGCSIYCIVKALWTSLAILAGMGLAAILIIFLLVWAVVKLETLGNYVKEFISY